MSAIFLKKIIYLFFFYWIISVFILIIYQAFFVQYFDYNYDFIIIFLIIQSFATIILSIIYGFCISIGKYRKGAITNSSSPLFKFIFILIIFYLISKSTEILILSSFFATLVSIVVGALFLKNYKRYIKTIFNTKIYDLKVPYLKSFFLYFFFFRVVKESILLCSNLSLKISFNICFSFL